MYREYNNLTGTTILFAGANIVSKMIKILLVPLYTYYLTTSEFGTAETVIITINLLYPVFLLGTGEAAIRLSKKKEYSRESVISNCITIVLAASATGIVLYIPLSYISVIRAYLPVMYIMTVAAALEALLAAEAKGIDNNTVYAGSEIVSAAALVLANVLMLVVFHSGITGYLWSFVASSVCRIIYITIRLKLFRLVNLQSINIKMIASILRFSLPIMPATILWWIMDSSGRYLVVWLIGASAAGIYSIAFRVSALLTSVAAIFHQAWTLSAIRQYNIGGYSGFYRSAMAVYSTMFFTAASLLICFVQPIIDLLNDSYNDAWRYAPVLVISAVFFTLSGFSNANYIVTERTAGALWTSMAGAAISIISGIVLTIKIGMQGAAIASLLSFYMMWLIMSLHTDRLIGTGIGLTGYIMIHMDLLILLVETYLVLHRQSYFFITLCIAALLLVNSKTIGKMARSIKSRFSEED